MYRDDEVYWALIAQSIPELTSKLQYSLLESLGDFRTVFDSDNQTNDQVLNKQLQLIRKKYQCGQWQGSVNDITKILDAIGAKALPITHVEYPAQLKQISKPPLLLYIRGDLNCLHLPQIAVVGSRRMTAGGDNHARSWAKYLAQHGFTITSGLALGIDASAHTGALQGSSLQAESGKTIGVMATGIEHIYPARNTQLADQIIDGGGALVTEFPPGTQPRPAHFPQRNRIISGLSLGVLVVEAAVKSGSLITAKYALEQNREVFAIPGSINNPQSKGCHQLIRQGATLVESVTDIVDELHGPLGALSEQLAKSEPVEQLPELSLEETKLLELMGYDPILIDDIHSPWSMEQLSQLLVSLEIKGVISNQQGYFQRVL
jgi:DNA processing protein